MPDELIRLAEVYCSKEIKNLKKTDSKKKKPGKWLGPTIQSHEEEELIHLGLMWNCSRLNQGPIN